MLTLGKLKISQKIWLAVLVGMAGILFMGVLSLDRLNTTMVEMHKKNLQAMVDSTMSTVQQYYEKAQRGEISSQEAKQRALAMVEAVRYGDGNYLWINDDYPRMIMHPMKSELNGQDLSNSKDPDGKALFNEMVKVVGANGQGFVDYQWPKPGFDKPVPKLSYVKGFEPWGWIIGTGVYLDDIEEAYAGQQLLMLLIIVPVLLVMGLIVYLSTRSFNSAISQLQSVTDDIAREQFEVSLDVERGDEFGPLNESVDLMRQKLSQASEQAVFNAQIRAAMDGVSTNVMIADNDRNVVYLNNSVKQMLRIAEHDLQKELPNFRADKVLNENIDQFHKNPAHQRSILENLTSEYIANIQVGGRDFRLQANPVLGAEGERLGTVIEWLDRTVEVKAGNEIANLVMGAAQGDFSRRVAIEGKEGFFLTIAEGLNELVETAEKGLNDAVRVLGDMAGGDMTQRMTGDYEGTFGQLKDYSNETAENLSQMLSEIRTATESIATASQEISQGNTDLSSRTEEQASNLEETASSMEELTSTVKQNTDNARQANSLSDQATEVAQAGGELISRVVATMNDINESAQKIEEIIGVIDSIAFQTNILALNAAVEAARAGDQGRGFAVVASEVRSLAQRSANAAKDIKGLIGESVSKIQSGNALVNESGGKTDEIVASIKRVSDINAEISAASEEQSSGIENVNTAVGQLDEMTQQNAALVEQAAAAAESQLSQVETLQQLVGKFRILEDQGQGGMAQAPRLEASRSAGKSQPPARKAPSAPRDLPQSDDDDWDTF